MTNEGLKIPCYGNICVEIKSLDDLILMKFQFNDNNKHFMLREFMCFVCGEL